MFKFMLYNDSEIIFYDTETHIVFSLGYFLAKIQKNTRPYQYQMINPLTNCYPIESSMGPNEEAREQFLDWISQGKGYPRIFPNPTNTNLDFCFDEMKIFKDGEYHGINDANELWNLNATLSSQLYATICRGFSKVTEEFKEYSQIYFCHNSTAASTTNKTLQILSPESTNWIKYGSVVHVFNENTNTATNPKFYIQNQAIPIYYEGQPITTDNLDLAGKAGQILTYYIYSEEEDNNQTVYCAMYMGSSEKNILTAGTNITINNNTISATDTKNTAGSTDSSSKLYLIGATSQAANPQTYSDNEVFVKDGVINAQELTIGSRKSGSTIGSNSVAEGVNTEASGNASHAEGNYTTASGTYSHAEGTSNTASGSGSHAEGTSTKAIGSYSHAEGYNTQATGDAAHAEGYSTQATYRGTHAEGYCSKATSVNSHAEGSYSVSMGDASHAEGYTIQYSSGTIGSIDKANLQLTVNGLPEHYGNYLRYVLSDKAYETGDYSIENSSRNSSSGAYTFTVSRWNSGFTVGAVVYIFGVSCTKGTGSHSEGLGTYAADVASHSEGKGTIATAQAQHVEGTWNIINSNLAHIVGNGTDNANRSNAYTLDWNGNGVYAGKLTVGTGPSNNMDVATKKYVDDSLLALPEPMIFKGSLGTGGTITTLPAASASNEGHTYKVITAGTYASQSAKIGDTFISDGSIWVLIPSGDEPSGTVTSVKIEATGPIAVNDNSAITTSGTKTISHLNSGVTAGTYRSVTVNDTGHVTAGTNPTTISDYGITDAKIANGTITLGSNTITPLTSHQDISGKEDISNKVTSLSSSSTNAQYPSAKVVYDQLALKQNTLTQGTNITINGNTISAIDTKNTAGSIDNSNKIYLIGATSQAANPQTYSNYKVYVQNGLLRADTLTIGQRKNGTTIGSNSVAEGYEVTASAMYAHAEGTNTTASNNCAHAEGSLTTASGNSSHAEGWRSTASGNDSHAEGAQTTASGYASHAEGFRAIASGQNAHAEGIYTYASGKGSHAEGACPDDEDSYLGTIVLTGDANATTYTTTDTSNVKIGYYIISPYDEEGAFVTGITANSSITLNRTLSTSAISDEEYCIYETTIASGEGSHAEGYGTIASGKCSHAGGWRSTASKDYSYAQGSGADATGQCSHAEGQGTTASGDCSHAEGYQTTASANCSHAEGSNTTASGSHAHAEGYYTTAQRKSQHTQGEYNILDTSGTTSTRGTYAHIVGNGTSTSNRSNAYTLDWSGNAWFAGDVYVGSTSGTNKDAGSKKLATEEYVTTRGYITTDTKNTAGSTDTSSKIYLVGATSQAANPQTYSDDEVYATSGTLTAKEFSLGTNAKIVYNTSESCIEFNFS